MSGENVTTVAGTELWVATALPATYTEAGYEALAWKKVGEVTDVPSVLGRTYNTSTHAPVDKAQQIEKKGSYKLGSADWKMGWDEDDEGQKICFAASLDYDVLSFKVVKQNGSKRYFTAQVSKFTEDQGTVDSNVVGAMSLLRQTDTIRSAT